MRVSQIFHLNRIQSSLDFVDVDPSTDISVFLDPRAIKLQKNPWANECHALLQSFFSEVLDAISLRNIERVRDLFRHLEEPNEVHFGYSRNQSRGRGLGSGKKADAVANTLSSSIAAATGLLEDLEDTSLFIPGIGADIISDITINVLRGALIGYTQRIAEYHGISMEEQHSGPVWNPNALEWQEDFTPLPRTNEGKLLLVPKTVVRHRLIYDKDKYYNGYLAPYLEAREIDAKSELVKVLKNGSPHVSRVELKEKYPPDKLAIVDYTLGTPEALAKYRDDAGKNMSSILDHDDLAATVGSPTVDYLELYEEIEAVSAGRAGATAYHQAVEKLLTALFYPSLGNFQLEKEIHNGRKRIDIYYDNLATVGFFGWLNTNYRCPTIPIECKNYSEDPHNPELDQLAGRLSKDRGWVGILTCRKVTNKELMIERCRDAAKDERGYLIVIDDIDLQELALEAQNVRNEVLSRRSRYTLLRKIFGRLIS
nr:hypothetical protein [Kibdelosporangium sp. MJ126-NF4]CEL17454.1 hypothetical protein [Kibdelosporangium sp. MJ126-NF4]CTQ91319.1 hypothetical protein [Kibdelosporangium sp. MJ126-NF4]